MASRTSPLLVSFASFLTVGSLAGWFLVLPPLRDYSAKKAELTALDAAYAAAGSVRTSRQDQDALTLRRAQVDQLLPVGDQQYDMVNQLEALSRQKGITLTSLAVTPSDTPASAPKTSGGTSAPSLPSGLRKLGISLSFSASYEGIQSYIQGLVSLGRFVQLEQVTINGGGGPGGVQGGGTLTAQISASAYYLPAPGSGSTATPAPAAAAAAED